MSSPFHAQEVGILGGGQLARMLAESALRLGLKPICYAEDAQGPASEICVETLVGQISDEDQLREFISRVSIVAFENEFVDCALLRASTRDPDSKFFPRLSAIETLQDKLKQKKLLQRLSIPTSPFTELKAGSDSTPEIERALQLLGNEIVLKWSRQGYDGKGVKLFSRGEPLSTVQAFLDSAWSRGVSVYAEKRVDFVRELAIIGCASVRGENVTYPLVISEQENGICKQVTGPAIQLGVSERLQDEAVVAALQISQDVRLCGSFGIEFFETRDGELLVNEIAPRVHNTGHVTQNAFAVSQFENHWRALLGLPLFDPLREPGAAFFAMRNLLGPEGVSLTTDHPALPVPGPHSELHWYGKREIRPDRKLGHLNGTADSLESLDALLKELEECESNWVQQLKKGIPS